MGVPHLRDGPIVATVGIRAKREPLLGKPRLQPWPHLSRKKRGL